MKTFIVAIVVMAVSSSILGNSTSASDFLTNLAPARPAAMGYAYSAISDDSAGIYFNPAGIASKTSEISTFYYNSFEADNMGIQVLTHYKNVSIGAGILRRSVDGLEGSVVVNGTVNKTGETLSYAGHGAFVAGAISIKKIQLGVSGKFVMQTLADDSSSGFGVNAGIQAQVTPWMKLGGHVENILSDNTWSTGKAETLSQITHIGVSFISRAGQVNSSLMTIEMVTEQDRDSYIALGAESWINSFLALRVGYDGESMNLGSRLKLFGTFLDMSYNEAPTLFEEAVYKVSLGIQI